MKIRTDFVTNSSSSSFVTITVFTKGGGQFEATYSSGNNDIDLNTSCGPIFDDEEELHEMSGAEIIEKAKSWFDGTFKEKWLLEEYDYSDGDVSEVEQLKSGTISRIQLQYNVDYHGDCGFISNESYDFESGTHDYEMTPNPEWDEIESEEPFDVFSCCEESDENNNRTKDLIMGALSPLRQITQGFGSYRYDSQKKPIKWCILAQEKDKALLITKMGIDTKKYNEEFEDVTWETCSLRKWLNQEFYNSAFTEQEKKMIVTSKVTADRNPEYNIDPGKDTQDKIFLLSIPEVSKYLNYFDRCLQVTPYAKKKGAEFSDYYGSAVWWLRSPGSYIRSAAYVGFNGSVGMYGELVFKSNIVVRPALWVKIQN